MCLFLQSLKASQEATDLLDSARKAKDQLQIEFDELKVLLIPFLYRHCVTVFTCSVGYPEEPKETDWSGLWGFCNSAVG